MKLTTLIDGLSECINDYVEGALDPSIAKMFERYLAKEVELGAFVHRSRQGKTALQNAHQVKAADDFEEKLAKLIAEEKRQSA